MRTTSEEQKWLAYRWSFFRDTVRVIAVKRSAPVIAEIVSGGSASDAGWRDFIAAVLADLAAKRQGRDGLFSTALSLFADPTPLRQCLEQAGALLGGEKGAAVRTLAFKRGLTRMRDIYIGGTAHRGASWGRLDALSRKVAQQGEQKTGHAVNRCTMDHFIDVLDHIRTHHAADHNLPRTLDGIADYFHEFCPDCGPREMDEDTDYDRPPPTLVEALPNLEAQAIHLMDCLDGLEEEGRRFVEVGFKMGNPVELSVSGFCQRLSIERRRFYRVLDTALDALRDCLTAKMADSFDMGPGYRSAWDEI